MPQYAYIHVHVYDAAITQNRRTLGEKFMTIVGLVNRIVFHCIWNDKPMSKLRFEFHSDGILTITPFLTAF